MAINGVVTNIESRMVTTKYGNKPVYDVYVNGDKYAFGFKDPTKMGITTGANIEFDFTAGRYGKDMTATTVKVLGSGTGAPATPVAAPSRSAPTAAPAASGGKFDCGFPIPVTSEKISILRQNALTNAVKAVSDFAASFGVTAELSGDEVIATILHTARAFADYTSGRDAERAVAAVVEKMSDDE